MKNKHQKACNYGTIFTMCLFITIWYQATNTQILTQDIVYLQQTKGYKH
jgi:hypothetical protein